MLNNIDKKKYKQHWKSINTFIYKIHHHSKARVMAQEANPHLLTLASNMGASQFVSQLFYLSSSFLLMAG